MSPAARRAHRGFTLLEMMVVVAIIGGMMALVFTNQAENRLVSSRLGASAAKLAGSLELLRTQALISQQEIVVDLDFENRGYSAYYPVELDVDGKILMDSPFEVNEAGFTIHSAVHMARHEVECVIHTHTVPGMAVSAQVDGLRPLTQNSMMFYGDHMAYHEYEGIALDLDERSRLQADLGNRYAMILRNHGLLTCGRTIGEAFEIMQNLEKACEAQIAAQAGGVPLTHPSPNVCAHTADQFWNYHANKPFGERAWPAMLRLLDRHNPGYDA